MRTRKQYKNPPLIEALCEFTFADANKDLLELDTIFGSSIFGEFPERIQRFAFTLESKSGDDKATKHNNGIIQYRNKEKNKLIQFGNNILTINHLKPFDSWGNFLKLILETITSYKKLVEFDKISQIQLRFINKIDISETSNSISDYFKYSLVVPDVLSTNIANFRLSSEHFLNDSKDVVSVSLFNSKSLDNDKIEFILDLNYILLDFESFDFSNLENWLNNAYEHIYTIFDATLTESCKNQFE